MMRFLLLATLSVLGFVGSTGSANAALESYEFDKAHTQIVFFVSHMGFSNSHGYFTDFDGSFEFNPDNPESGAIEVIIKTDSINMVNHQKWNDHMTSADLFNVAEHPDMAFKSTDVVSTGDNTAKLIGDFTLLGVTKSVSLDVTFNKAGKHPLSGKYVAGFSASGMIKRSDFGMNYGLPMIGDEIELRIEVEGVRQNGADGNQ